MTSRSSRIKSWLAIWFACPGNWWFPEGTQERTQERKTLQCLELGFEGRVCRMLQGVVPGLQTSGWLVPSYKKGLEKAVLEEPWMLRPGGGEGLVSVPTTFLPFLGTQKPWYVVCIFQCLEPPFQRKGW